MEHAAPAVFVALEHSGFAAAIRQSTWIYPVANVGHIVSLVCFAAAVAVMDLRLLGVFAGTAPGPLIVRARRFVIAAFCGLVATGFLLFSAEASHVAINPVFQIKIALVVLGLLNAGVFELAARRWIATLPAGAATPLPARAAGVFSLGIWLAVAASGRAIAYF
jgi:hypothetical protein